MDKIEDLKDKVELLENNYKILYKQNPFLNDNISFDIDTKKLFNIHRLNNDKYSLCDIHSLYLNYIYKNKLIDEDIINLNINLKENLNTSKNSIFIKELFELIKLKFNN